MANKAKATPENIQNAINAFLVEHKRIPSTHDIYKALGEVGSKSTIRKYIVDNPPQLFVDADIDSLPSNLEALALSSIKSLWVECQSHFTVSVSNEVTKLNKELDDAFHYFDNLDKQYKTLAEELESLKAEKSAIEEDLKKTSIDRDKLLGENKALSDVIEKFKL